MAEVTIQAINKLKALPKGLHWFCSRSTDDAYDCCYDEDIPVPELEAEAEDAKKVRKKRREAAGERKRFVLDAVQIFAFDGEEAKPLQDFVLKEIENLMRTCDVCVRTYHAARVQLKEKLDAEYEAEEVIAFMDRFDGINVERIKKGLHLAEQQLLHLAPEKRRIGNLAPEGLYALFEAMTCEPYLRNEQLMRSTFDEPFQLIQTIKPLRLPAYLPACAYFIFSDNKARIDWAEKTAWKRFTRPPTTFEFDFMVKKPLELALRRVQLQSLEVAFLPRFWFGFSTITARLSSELITQSLRPMEANVARLVLDHFSLKEIDIPTFAHLTSAWKELLEKSPEAFWDAMRSIPAKAIIEQCFKSPAMNEVLMRPTAEGMPRMEDIFAWIRPFTASIKGNPVPVCGALVREFMARSKNDHFDRAARSYCFTLALHIIDQTLQNIMKPKTLDAYVGSAVVAEMLEQITEHLPLLMEQGRQVKNGAVPEGDKATALSIVENAVGLDCLTLVQDQKAIQLCKSRGHTAPKSSKDFWQRLVGGILPNDQAMFTRVLLGAREIVSLEKFSSKFSPRAPEDPKEFATAYDARCNSVALFLERMSDFQAYQLAGLFKTPETAGSIVHLLFCSDSGVRQSAVDVLKALSDKTDRLEALAHALDNAFFSFLTAFTQSTTHIASKVIFTPMPQTIKLCSDVIDALCNSSTGILRLRNLTSQEVDATRALWRFLWSVSETIFKNMESWGIQGHDKTFMMDFCRDTMQFADTLFDQYSVFLNVIVEEYDEEQQRREKAKQLLQHPRNVMNTMVRWLRLRDDFLIEKILTLVTSLLARLSKSKVAASEEALDYIEEVATKKIKTNLKSTQLALLRDAIDKYSDRRLAIKAMEERKKAAKQTQLNSWATSGRSKDDAIDLDSEGTDHVRKSVMADITKNQEKFKQLKGQRKAQELAKSKKAVPPPKKNMLNANEFLKKRKLEEEEARKKKAAAIAAARGGIPGPGSGMNGLGVATKDHSMKGQGVMVDSDDDSSSDSDSDDSTENDLDRELFGKAKKSARPSNAMPEAEAKKLLAGPVKVRKVQRSAKDMRARLVPDLSKLHQEILSWDYFHNGYYPPNTREEDYKSVPKAVDDAKQYVNIFKPLLVLETWRKICNDKDQDSQAKPYEVKVITRSSVDAFVEVNTSMPPPMGDSRLDISEGDLVLLSNARDPRASRDAPSCLGRIHKISRKKGHVEVLYRVMPGNKFTNNLNGGTAINAFKIESLITVEREYGALMGLQFYDLNEYIMQAVPSKLLKYSDSMLGPLMKNYQLNQAQARAVKSALDNDAFTLIQGPPGSGKTKTIVATVGAILSETLKNSGAPVKRPGAPNGVVTSSANSKKLLICAPSNAAVDELVLRLKESIRTTSGQDKKINVVRLGRSEKINPQVMEVTLEELVSARLNKAAGNSESQRAQTHNLMQEHKQVSTKLNESHDQKDAMEQKNENVSKLMEDINALRRRKKELSLLIDQAKDKEQNTVRQNDLEKKRVEQQILDEAHILCATLSASGHDRFQNLSLEFETVIVDEAAQCTELQALIPLKYGAAKCILVGDPKQLPPTTFMDAKLNFQYEQSLFVRMQNNSPQDVHLLDTQYRMHPEISSFPSKQFYDSRLLDGPDMAKLREKLWHKDPILGPYRFFDVQGQQTFTGSSLTNKMEIDAAIQLFNKLTDSCASYDFRGKIGIITPYKAQFNAMKRRFQDEFGSSIFDQIEFNTTDAFQGRECEIIIFSCVRASEGSIGFLSDYRRMNVGLTRAKCSLWVLGNTNSLVNGKYWRAMIEDAQKRNRISSVRDIGKSRPASTTGAPRPAQNPTSRLNYDDRGVDSSDNSRRSSASSMSNHSRLAPTGPSSERVKKEYAERIKPEPKDVEMKDVFNDVDRRGPGLKLEQNSGMKRETKKDEKPAVNRVVAPAPPKDDGPGPGYLQPPSRAPGKMPVKRKAPGNNALLDTKRKKH